MIITIYDYENKPTEVNIPVKSVRGIKGIFVHVLSGDETGFVLLKHGNHIPFDASNCRIQGYDDGSYFVKRQNVEKWLNFKFEERPENGRIAPDGHFIESYAYQRQEYLNKEKN